MVGLDGVTFYATRCGTDDLVHRISVFLQMIGAALAINIHGALGETSGNFPISYAAIRAYAGEWLICGSVSLCLFSIGIIQLSIASANGRRKVMIWSIYRLIAGFAIIIIPILSIRSYLRY